MAIFGFTDYANAFDGGNYHYQYVFKATTPSPITAGLFVDVNQSTGIPVYNPFAGSALTFTPLTGSRNQGVYTGPTPSTGLQKYLASAQFITTTSNGVPLNINICDYLGFYSLIDGDSPDLQEMDNVVGLTRYTNGEGVRIVLVATAPMTATASCTIVYTNSAGVSGRTVTFNVIPAAGVGICATGTDLSLGGAGQATPFVRLASGDSGVRSIQSIQFATGAGGFIAACLVKPIASVTLFEQNVPTEKVFGFDTVNMPKIEQGAYLNFLMQCGSTGNAALQGELVFLNL